MFSEIPRSAHNLEFVSLETARVLVGMAVASRIDEHGVLLPIIEDRVRTHSPGRAAPPPESVVRHDIVLPPLERKWVRHPEGGYVGSGFAYGVQDYLYRGFTRPETVQLSPAEIRNVAREGVALKSALSARPDTTWFFENGRNQGAYHVDSTTTPGFPTDGLIAPVRLYLSSGIDGLRTARSIIEQGAEFAHAKVWTPQAAPGRQTIRYDVPIFEFETAAQLASTIEAVHSSGAHGDAEHVSPVGIAVPGVVGATILQFRGSSANEDISTFFAGPVTEACNHPDLALRTGDFMASAWLDDAAQKTQEFAARQAESAGLHPQTHALLQGQDLDVIMHAIGA